MQINNVVIAGRLTKEVSFTATKDGTPLSRFTLANTQGKHTNYFTVVSFSKTADYAHKYLHKGQRVTVVGKLNHKIIKDKDGTYHDYWTIIANSFDAIHPKPQHSDNNPKDPQQKPDVKKLYARMDELAKKVNAASDKK